ncbi:hypothetical protein [Ekhidna sp.]|uniref:hypothetical protein n=1 Tax=Ekhidna sp. TaxID=2608089 RepID=UPI0032993C84
MRISKYISKKLFQTTFGIVIGLFVLTQSVLVNEQVPDNQEQSDSEGKEKQQITKPTVALSTSLQINLDYQSYLVTEVFHQGVDDKKTPLKTRIIPTLEKALKVLFRQIISPNAP